MEALCLQTDFFLFKTNIIWIWKENKGSHLELSVASGAVDGDKSGEDAHQEEDQHHVLREPNVLAERGWWWWWRENERGVRQ